MKLKKHGLTLTTLFLFSITLVLILYKVLGLGYTFANIIPQIKYEVNVFMSCQGFGEPVEIKTYLPVSDNRQIITEEINNSVGFIQELTAHESGRISKWKSDKITGNQQIQYSFITQGERIRYLIDDNVLIPLSYPLNFQHYLSSTSVIQINHPVIEDIYRKIVPQTSKVKQVIHPIFDFVYKLTPVPFKGLTDAVTAAKLGEASCNGKSRLFVALLRRANIPARLVGGLILTNGIKRTSHQWVEIYLLGHWVPFDTLNNHFAEIPQNYLVLYRDDEVLFKHTANINFDFNFKIKKLLSTRSELVTGKETQLFNIYNLWYAFRQIGIPISLLKIIIMLPLGAFMVTIFRNIIGLETFGTFLPALIAAASRETGFIWGIVGFLLIVILVSLIHYPLENWGLLHTPKMNIMLICVVTVMLAITVAGVKLKLYDLSHVSLFPIAVLTITAERVALTLIEDGFKRVLKIMLMTTIVVGFCYLAMNSLAMESLFLAFPELFLILIILNFWLGRWIGIRLTEFHRFRWLVE